MDLLRTRQTVSPPFIQAKAMQDKRKDISKMLESLQSGGRFLVNASGESFYFDSKTRSVASITEGDRDFMLLMGRHEFCPDKTFIERAKRHALSFGTSVEVYRMAYVKTSTSTVYVHSQGSEVFRITSSGIETVQNGADDVYFICEQGSTPFSLVDLPAGCGDLLLKHIAKVLPLAKAHIDKDQARFLVMSWLCALFLPDLLPMMPLLVLVGPPSAGKSTFMRLINELLFGRLISIFRTPINQKSFDSEVGHHRMLCMDNVTEWFPWLDGRIENVARRETIQIRKGQNIVEKRLDCAMMMAARQIPDAGLQCISRLLPIILEKPERSVPERELIESVRHNRNAIMTQLMLHLQKLLADIDSGAPGYEGPYASADFADVAYRLARTIGFEQPMADAFDRMAELHDAALPGDQQVFMLLDQWLSNSANVDRQVRATELQKELVVIAKEKGISFTMSERPFAHWLKARLNDIRQFFAVHAWEARSRQFFYRFSRKQVETADF